MRMRSSLPRRIGVGSRPRGNGPILVALASSALLLGLAGWPLAWLPAPIGENAPSLIEGMHMTLLLTAVSGCAGGVLGLAAALARTARHPLPRALAGGYLAVVRGTPLLVQILFAYFALPVLLPALRLTDFASACVALALNAGAYNAEAIRAGLLAVPRGQVEAANALGLTRLHTWFDVVLPQALRIALPSLVNNGVGLLKDSSLAYAIGVVELTNVGNRIQAASFQPLPVLAATAAIYLLATSLMTWIAAAVERRFDVVGERP